MGKSSEFLKIKSMIEGHESQTEILKLIENKNGISYEEQQELLKILSNRFLIK